MTTKKVPAISVFSPPPFVRARCGILLGLALLLLGCPAERGLVAIREVQGAGHRSPLEGERVEVRGVVTAVDPGDETRGFWLQEAALDSADSADLAASRGIFVEGDQLAEDPAPGDLVRVAGRILESGREGDLTVTTVAATAIHIEDHQQPLPAAVVLGIDGRRPPDQVIDDDSFASFDPATDGVDFFESLEGMRVEVRDAVVVGPTSRYGEWVVVGDRGMAASVRTDRGGLALRPDDGNPERILVASRLLAETPSLAVGATFEAPIRGVLDYGYGNFKMQPDAVPAASPPPVIDEITRLEREPNRLTVASFNVLNLSAASPPEQIARVAAVIARDLAGPDLVALQEIQDANGPLDDGTVDGEPTMRALIAAVIKAGGPSYSFSQIDPLDGADGGQPGGNIRVALLFDPARVEWIERVDREESGTELRIDKVGEGPRLLPNPGRIEPDNPAFARSRKPMGVELSFHGEKIFLAIAHLRSKGGDDALMGARQPPRWGSEEQRMGQVEALRRFMDRLLEQDPGARVVVLGDFNEHEFRSPVLHLSAAGWANLVARIPLPDRYTFNYQGNSQVLDHLILSPALVASGNAEVDIVHVDADFPHDNRASDHDPIVARLTF